jgi:glycosyl transferase, family 25
MLPPAEIADYIDHVLYINLDSRPDRRQAIEEQLSVFPPSKVTRIPAKKHDLGHVGCFQSHVAALEVAVRNRWRNVLVVEDDMVWRNVREAYPIFKKLVSRPYDCIALGGTFVRYDRQTYRLTSSQTTHAYLVNGDYVANLLVHFQDGLALLEANPDVGKYRIDVWWRSLQKRDRWYIVHPSLCGQSDGYSDIQQARVSYSKSKHRHFQAGGRSRRLRRLRKIDNAHTRRKHVTR